MSETPHSAYATIAGTFAGGLALAGLVARRRPVPERAGLDLAVLALATFKAARTLARDDVASFVRDPFVEGDDRPVQTGGMRQAIGELVTCSRCIGTWTAAGLVATDALAPRFGRILTWTLAAGGANDFLQCGFAAFTNTANRLKSSSE